MVVTLSRIEPSRNVRLRLDAYAVASTVVPKLADASVMAVASCAWKRCQIFAPSGRSSSARPVRDVRPVVGFMRSPSLRTMRSPILLAMVFFLVSARVGPSGFRL